MAFTAAGPWWGVIERIWATAVHIGFTVILAAMPLLVLVTVPLHIAMNLVFLHLFRRGTVGAVNAAGLVVGAVIMGVGLLLH